MISTDSPEMAYLARKSGVEVPFMRPPSLAMDGARSQDVILHALDSLEKNSGYRSNALLLLQPTSPLRKTEDIDECIRLFLNQRPDGVVSITNAGQHPYSAKQIVDGGRLVPFFPNADMTANRQTWPRAYVLNGAIFLRRTDIYRQWDENMKKGTNPEGQHVLGYVMPRARSIEIDDELDFIMAESLLRRLEALNLDKGPQGPIMP